MRFSHIRRCRGFKTICVQVATVTAGVWMVVALAGPLSADSRAIVKTTPDRLVDEAGQAKTDGNSALAYALLREVVDISPENSLARWQLGQVKVGDEWLSIEEAERRAAADPLQAKYLKRRDAANEKPAAQLQLARWCRSNKLDEEARFHFASFLASNPNNQEAMHALGMRWHNGQLMSLEDIKDSNQDANDVKTASRQWPSRVSTWLRLLSNKNEPPPMSVINEIRAVTDTTAIPFIEKVTLDFTLASKEKSPGKKQLSLTFLSALKEMRGEEGTNSLLRFAVLSPFIEVRSGAIAELHYRPLHDYMPTLLDGIVAPIKSAYRVLNDPAGSVHYIHAMYREGAFNDWSYQRQRSILQPGDGLNAAAMSGGANILDLANVARNSRSNSISRTEARQQAQNYEQEIVASEQKVAEENQKNAALNERIIAVLVGTTDQNLGSEPRAWWNWWQDYTDYYRGGDRPVYGVQDSSSVSVRPPVLTSGSSGSVECFAKGTPVWTKTGQRPIESLEMGDLVLAQNVNTGELRYKPVIARTLRPAGPIVQVATEDEKFLATRGHPLWVEGVGWRMTKELEDGAVLHSLAGGGRIRTVVPATDRETYNLVVADFNTYFVGASGVLAHDNTPRRPTQAKVPGVLLK